MNILEQRITKESRAHVHSEKFSVEMCEQATELMVRGYTDDAEVENFLLLFTVSTLTNTPVGALATGDPATLDTFLGTHQREIGTIFDRFNSTAHTVLQVSQAGPRCRL